MNHKYIVLRDGKNQPSHFAMTKSNVNLNWLQKLYHDAAVYEQVPLRNPTAGKIFLDKYGRYHTVGFDVDVRTNSDIDDGVYIDNQLQLSQEMQFLVSCDVVVILNNWPIPPGEIHDGFLVSNSLHMGTFTCIFEDQKYKITDVTYIREVRGLAKELENVLNTVPILCC